MHHTGEIKLGGSSRLMAIFKNKQRVKGNLKEGVKEGFKERAVDNEIIKSQRLETNFAEFEDKVMRRIDN